MELNTSSSKTLGEQDGERKDISDLKLQTPAVFFFKPLILPTDAKRFNKYYENAFLSFVKESHSHHLMV